jgi:hypothetical protein
MSVVAMLYCLGNNNKKMSLYMFSTDVGFFQIFWIHSWLNLWIQDPWVREGQQESTIFYKEEVVEGSLPEFLNPN